MCLWSLSALLISLYLWKIQGQVTLCLLFHTHGHVPLVVRHKWELLSSKANFFLRNQIGLALFWNRAMQKINSFWYWFEFWLVTRKGTHQRGQAKSVNNLAGLGPYSLNCTSLGSTPSKVFFLLINSVAWFVAVLFLN